MAICAQAGVTAAAADTQQSSMTTLLVPFAVRMKVSRAFCSWLTSFWAE